MTLIIESSDQQVVNAIAAVAKAFRVHVQLRDDATSASESNLQKSLKKKRTARVKTMCFGELLGLPGLQSQLL